MHVKISQRTLKAIFIDFRKFVMTGCCVINCTNSSTKGYKMCRIPRDENRKKIWVNNINRPNWLPTNHSVICEVSFNLFIHLQSNKLIIFLLNCSL